MKDPLDYLLDISREWVSLPRASDVAQAAISFLRTAFQIDAGFVSYVRRPRRDGLDYLHTTKRWFTSWGLSTSEAQLRQTVESASNDVRQRGRQHWYSVNELPEAWQDIFLEDEIQQVGVWTVKFQHEPAGLLVLAKKSEAQVDKVDITRCMAHIALVLEMAVNRRQAEELSIRDPLTGVFNRRGLLLQFANLTGKGEPLTLAVVDLDGFKQFNDHHGHAAGDVLLTNVAQTLSHHARAYRGVSARLGGDEFVILARYTTRNSIVTAERISAWLLEEDIKASVGCAAVGIDGEDFDSCYRAADLRLYDMKLSQMKL